MRRGAKALLILGVSIPAALFDDGRLFLFVPVLINAALLVAFGRTLVNGPSTVETFARPPPPHHRAIRSVIRRPSSLSATLSS